MDNRDSGDPAGTSETVKVNIFDQTYSLRSQKGVEHLMRIAEMVDERMRQISAHTTTFELSRIAILAALNIADELQDLKTRQAQTEGAAAQPSAEPNRAEAQSGRPAAADDAGKAQTWFEAIFDAEVPVKQRSERLSSQISSRLQTNRQENSKDSDKSE
jgi:cell division protein ZapA